MSGRRGRREMSGRRGRREMSGDMCEYAASLRL